MGMGNIRSVANALIALNCDIKILEDVHGLSEAERIVLPGVGAFGDAMRHLREGNWIEPLEREVLKKGKIFLGICLGLQVLGTTGTEHGLHQGLNWIPGKVDRLQVSPKLRIPHVGWNNVLFQIRTGFYSDLGETQAFYFVHSYALEPEDKSVVSGVCEYGTVFTASIQKDNIIATQYHPEKSQKAGLAVLKNFLKMRS